MSASFVLVTDLLLLAVPTCRFYPSDLLSRDGAHLNNVTHGSESRFNRGVKAEVFKLQIKKKRHMFMIFNHFSLCVIKA